MKILIILLIAVFLIVYIIRRQNFVKNRFEQKPKYYNIDDEFNAKRKERQDEIDKLLSKIGKNGLNDLSENERKRLDELSKK